MTINGSKNKGAWERVAKKDEKGKTEPKKDMYTAYCILCTVYNILRTVHCVLYSPVCNRSSGLNKCSAPAADRSTGQCPVFRPGGRTGTQDNVLCSEFGPPPAVGLLTGRELAGRPAAGRGPAGRPAFA